MKLKNSFFIVALFLTSFFCNSKDLFLGDSLTLLLRNNYEIDSDIVYFDGSGLNSKENWNDLIKNIDTSKYNDVYISLGANDQAGSNYAEKVKLFLDSIENKGKIYWFLPPDMKNKEVNQRVYELRKTLLNLNVDVVFINPSDYFGYGYVNSLNGIKIRADDGIHYTNDGASALINYLFTFK